MHMKKLILGIFLSIGLFMASIGLFPHVYAAHVGNQYDVEVTIVYGDGPSDLVSANLMNKGYGSSVSVDFGSWLNTNSFAYYIVNGEVISNQGEMFRVKSDLNIIAVVQPAGQNVAVFIDSNGQYLGVDYVANGATPVAPDISELSKPGYSVDSENPWSPAISALSSNQIYEVQYALDAANTFSASATNASLTNENPAFNEIVTATAVGTSGYWLDNNVKIAYGLTYSFSALSDRDITYVESAEAEEALVSLYDVSGIRDGYESYLGQVYVPDGYELIEWGFLFDSEEEALTLDNAEVVKPSSALAGTNEFLRSVESGLYTSIRAYATVDNGSSLETIYSDVNVFAASSGANDLFISEVLDWNGGTNKAIELYNGTNSSINLSDYSIKVNSNDNSTWTNTTPNPLPNIDLNAGETYVLTNASESSITALSDSTTTASFNGDDAIGLFKNDVLIDIFGVFGEDPGSGWAISGGNTADVSIIRNASVTGPYVNNDADPMWEPNEWTATSSTADNLGSHTMESGSSSASLKSISTIKTEVETDLNAPSVILDIDSNYTLPNTNLYGSSVSWSVLSGSSYIDNAGVVSRPAYGVGDQEATLQYTISVGGEDVVGTITLNILEEEQTFTVSFDANGGDANPDPQVVVAGEFVSQPATPTNDGYVLTGWFDAASGGNEWDFANDPVSGDMTLYAQWNEIPSGSVTYIETFSNFSLSGSSYDAGTFAGDNGITWSFTESRGDFDLDGQAIMLDKDGDGASLSATISGGISSFSVEFYDAYSGAAQVEVYINGTLVGTSMSHDGDSDDTPVLFEISSINVTGEFTIEILSGGSQMVIDNLTWISYSGE